MSTPLTTKLASAPAAVFDPLKGCLRIRVSAPVPDRDDEIVDPATLRLDQFRNNPVILFGHDQHSRLPVAKAENPTGQFRCWLEDGDLWQEWWFGDTPEALAVARLYQQKILRGASIGFRSDGLEIVTSDEAEVRYGVRKKLHRHVGGELYETSAVPVPSCPAALADRWIDMDLAAGVIERGWVGGTEKRAVPELVTKGLKLFVGVGGSGFPPQKPQSVHPQQESTEMSQATVTAPTEKAAPEATATPAATDTVKAAVPDNHTINVTINNPAAPVRPEVEKAAPAVVVKSDAVPADNGADTTNTGDADGSDSGDVKSESIEALIAALEQHVCELCIGAVRGQMDQGEFVSLFKEACKDIAKYSGKADESEGESEEDKEVDGEEADEIEEKADDEDDEDEMEDEKAFVLMVRKAMREELAPVQAKLAEFETAQSGIVDIVEQMVVSRR